MASSLARSTMAGGRRHHLQWQAACAPPRRPSTTSALPPFIRPTRPRRRPSPRLSALASSSSSSSSSSSIDGDANSTRRGNDAIDDVNDIDDVKLRGIRGSDNVGNDNADPDEVEKFSSLSSTWWDSRSNPLVGMNPTRVRFIREIVADFQSRPPRSGTTDDDGGDGRSLRRLLLSGRRCLDVGCGGGLLTESLSRLGASLVVGLDASPRVVDVARVRSSRDRNIRYIGGMTVEELASRWPYEEGPSSSSSSSSSSSTSSSSTDETSSEREGHLFDVVTALEVIEHVPDPTSLLRAATSLLRPGGILFVSTINRTMKSYGLAIIAAEYLSGKVPIGTHDWNQFRSPGEVERMVCDGGDSGGPGGGGAVMRPIEIAGMVIEPPFVDMRWSLDASDVDVNWIGAYQKRANPQS